MIGVRVVCAHVGGGNSNLSFPVFMFALQQAHACGHIFSSFCAHTYGNVNKYFIVILWSYYFVIYVVTSRIIIIALLWSWSSLILSCL